MQRRTKACIALGLSGALLLAACGDDDDTTDDAAATTAENVPSATASVSAGTPGGASLADVCPATVVVQTDWFPEAEHGGTYQLLGAGYTVDKERKTVTGPLVAGGTDTGVKIEIRTGGPAIGFQQVTAQMYTDASILFGFVTTDEAVQNFAKNPTIAVITPLEKNPQIVMWDPATYPDAKTIADLPDSAKVHVFGPGVFSQWLIGKGIVNADQIQDGYDGGPTRFIAEGGKLAQQGFASAEPYQYLNEFKEWGKPVAFQLIHDTGLEMYSQALAVKPEKLTEEADCLKAIVPIFQQAAVDYANDPAATNAAIIDIVAQYADFWVYGEGVAAFSVEQQLELGLVGNGPDSTIGNFDEARVQKVIDNLVPIFKALNQELTKVPTAKDIVTNEFIDPSIKL